MVLNMLFDNYDLLMDSPNSTVKMRKLILQLAVQGKLVEQDPTDEPASELLKCIKAEKEKLIAEGKIKKRKPLPPVAEDEILYELPQGWEWVRLGEITNYGASNKVEPDNVKDDEIWVLELEDIEKTTSILLKKVRYKDRPFKSTKNVFLSGDVLYGKLRPYLDKVLVADEDGICTTEILPLRSEIINPYYLRYSLKRKDFLEYVDSVVYGMKMPRLGTKDGQVALIPLPPLAEQERIVSKVDQLMQLCDQLDACQKKASTKYESLNDAALEKLLSAKTIEEFAEHWQFLCNNFDLIYNDPAHVNKLRQAILQLAVHGKLAPQDPNDEPASELLERIKAEKEKLIAEGKIRKQKPLPEISEDEKPFNLPEGWEFVRFGAAFDVTSSKRIHVRDYVSEGVPFFRSKEIGELKNRQPISTNIFISFEKYEELGHLSGFPNIGDLMLTSVGSIGNTWICDGRDFYYKDGNITKVGSHQYADMRYVQDFIDAPLFNFQVTNTVSGTAYNALTIVKLNNLIFPLPPLAEQHRIVAKVDQLMHLCDELETRLNQSKKDSEMLMQAVLYEAFS